MKKLEHKILISAHEFSPYLGSECKHAWNVLKELSFKHELTILFNEHNQFGINNYKQDVEKEKYQFSERTTFIAIKNPTISKIISTINKYIFSKGSNIGNPYLYFLAVKFWEKKVLRLVKKNRLEENISIIHHFNHISFREPGYLWKLNKPFIWGPVSGTMIVPRSFIKTMRLGDKLKNYLRNLLNYLTKRLSFRVYGATIKSDKILCVSNEDAKFFLENNNSVEIFPDVGLTDIFFKNNSKNQLPKLRAAWIGRIDSLKSLDILIEAANLSETIQKELDIIIIGEGPLLEKYKKTVMNLGLDNIFTFIGKIPHKQIQDQIIKVDFLIHTSIKEATSTVILEGLQSSKPFIAHNAFGIRPLINKNLGFGVEYKDIESSISGFKNTIESILNDHSLLLVKKKSIQLCLKELTYKKLSQDISDIYRKIK